MTARQKTVILGTLFGIVAGMASALTTMHFVPSIGHSVRLDRLSRDIVWALFFSSPFGAVVGASTSAFMYWRARARVTAQRAIIETMTLAAFVSAVATQMVLPVSWGLPRATITAIVVGCASVLAILGSLVLWPLCRTHPK